MEEFKSWFNQEGTITGWQSIIRSAVAIFVYAVAMTIAGEMGGAGIFLILPALVFYVWLLIATQLKRFQAFGFVGKWYNLLFPALTDGTYPKRATKSKKK